MCLVVCVAGGRGDSCVAVQPQRTARTIHHHHYSGKLVVTVTLLLLLLLLLLLIIIASHHTRHLLYDKEQQEYMRWLEGVNGFVKGEVTGGSSSSSS